MYNKKSNSTSTFLNLAEPVSLLEATLNEKKAADVKISQVAQSNNVEAPEEVEINSRR